MRPWLVGVLFVSSCDFTPGTSASVCEAMCAWAIACHDEEREIDSADLRDRCLSTTYGVDRTCEDADLGALTFAGFEALTPCIAAVDERRRALECDPFTGSGRAIQSGTPPAQCIGAGRDAGAVFEAAREVTAETSAELCDRFVAGLCSATATCIADRVGGTVPSELIGELGEPIEVCEEAVAGVFAEACREDERYTTAFEPNPARDAARACLAGPLEAPECEALLAGELDARCAEAFASPAEGSAVGAALSDVAEAYAVAP